MNKISAVFMTLLCCFATTVAGAATCPSGYVSLEKPAITIELGNSCPSGSTAIGTTMFADCSNTTDKICMFLSSLALCSGGITKLKTGTGKSYNIYSTKETKPALAFRTSNGTVCYSKLASGKSSGDVNIFYNGAYYHVTD